MNGGYILLRRKRGLMFLISLIFLLILIPTVCATDNETALFIDENSDSATVSISNNGSDILKASNDYYFDASVESDGDGSQAKPYKYLTANRIRANSNIYLANGEYNLDTSKSVQQVNIIGSDVEKTIINYDGIAFTVSNYLSVKNVTFIGSSITNNNQFTAINTVFIDGYGSRPDSYTNNYGGAIYTAPDLANALVSVDNCTFKNNYAQYGGAIYMGSGVLEVANSLFYGNYAYNYGGAIACEYITNVTVKKSKFYNSISQDDAGGSIYIRESSLFKGEDITVVNSSATFGGAITTLNTDVSLTGLSMYNNSAKYDGGAIYQMYGDFSLFYSNFENNSAENGGALFIDNSTNVYLKTNVFSNNHAENAAGAIFSLFNKFTIPFERFNTFRGNAAEFQDNVYYVNELNLTIGNRNYTMYNVKINPITSLPSKYSLVDDGFTTAVKDQQSSGNCWAFTAIAVLESCILKASGDNLDLSEENMKNIIELYSDYGWKMDTNNGGYDYMPWGYLTSWLGPVSEVNDLFDDHSTLSPVINSVMHVQNIKFLSRSSYTDNDEIKKAILQYGAVGTGIYYDSYYYNSLTDSYYNWVSSGGNHAVTIVGWDDTYSKSNFKFASSIEGDGAWIVRNSWGPNWGKDGYFYVSYYDATLARPNIENNAYTIILNDTIKFDKNYQYDIAGITDYFLNSSSKVWYKNKFTATSDEYLAAVSTYFEKASNWMASVYVNGELKDVLSGNTTPGYYTFNLNKFISLNAGDVFEVVFNITTDGVAGFPISEIFSLNKLTYAPEISYVSWDGENWNDLYSFSWAYATHTYTSQVACIKAFTVTDPINTQTSLNIGFLEDQPLNITAIVKDEYGNMVKYGNVTFNINGENQIVGVKDGVANLLYDLNNKLITVFATFESEGYNQSSNSSYYSVPKIPIKLRLNVLQDYNNVEILIKANKMINENVIVNINGNETLFKLINGSNILYLKNLTNNIYNIAVLLLEESDYIAESVVDEITIDLHKTVILSDNMTVTDDANIIYNITMLDENDKPVVNREIAFTINNATYKNITDENGSALINIMLNKGIYDVDVSFDGDNNYFKVNSTNTIKVKGKIWINLDINTYQNNAFVNIYASNLINETFTVLINGTPQTVVSKDGVASLSLCDLSNGDYEVKVLLDEEEYEFNEVNSHFTIENVESANITSNVEIIGDDAIINISVENASGRVNVIVDGVSDVVELNNSQASYIIKNITLGNHTLVIIYDGDDFKQSFISEVFSVAKKESEISLVIQNSKIGELSIITAEVTPDATGFVIVNVNGTEYMINLSKTKSLSLVLNEVGQYSVVATYLGDERYNSSKSGEYELNVSDKSLVNVTVQIPEIIKVGNDVEINVSCDDAVDLKVYIDGELQEIVNEKIQFTALKAGLHNVQVIFDENKDYYGINKTFSFNVVKNDANIFINVPQIVFVGENITINALTESDGKLNITINGQVINSSYVIPFKGTFVIVVESAETEMYNSAVNSTIFTSQKQSSDVALNITHGKAGEKTEITVNVTQQATGNVSVIVDGVESVLALVNGSVSVVLDNMSAGNHSVVVIYSGDETYDSAHDVFAFSVASEEVIPKKEVNATINVPADIKSGGDANVSVDIANATGNVSIIVDGKETTVPLVNGSASVSLDNIASGNHSIVVIYSGDETHAQTHSVSTFTVPAEVVIRPVATEFVDIAVFSDSTVSAILVDETGKPITNAKINYAVGSQSGSVVTDSNGMFTIKGESGVVMAISYAGDDNCLATNTTIKFDNAAPAVRDSTVIVGNNYTQYAIEYDAGERGQNFTTQLVDSMGNPIANKTVLIGYNGKTLTRITNATGHASVQINLRDKNRLTFAVTFLGDKDYNATMSVYLITINQKPVTIAAAAKTYKATAKTKKYTVSLKTILGASADGKTYFASGKKVTMKINGKTYTAKTNANGQATFALKITKKGTYAATVNFAGDTTYNAASKKVKITIN